MKNQLFGTERAHPLDILSRLKRRLTDLLTRIWNPLVPTHPKPETDNSAFREVLSRARRRTDISDHLATMFVEAYASRPSLIVELGVRDGESTFVFERVARAYECDLISVDIEPCEDASDYERWHFVQQDDVEFGRRFPDWCENRDVPCEIDVLFVDTSHLFEHTLEEISTWFPHLSNSAVVLFHDTNLTTLYRRRDGSLGRGWDNDRGVIRALEEYLGVNLDESRYFRTLAGGFAIEHNPECNGLTVLRGVPNHPQSPAA